MAKRRRTKGTNNDLQKHTHNWHTNVGDKCTQFFCNVELKKTLLPLNETISELIDDDGKQFSNHSDILKNQNYFYKNLQRSEKSNNTDSMSDKSFYSNIRLN